MGGQGRVLHAR